MRRLISTRLLRLALLPAMALTLALGIASFAVAQTTPPDDKAPHGIPELQGIPRDQLFDHFRGSQFTITDAQGNVVVYQMTPGTISSVTSTSVTVTPNGESTAVPFNVTPTTRVRARPADGSLQALVQGDKVVVLSKQGSSDAVAIMKHTARMGGMHGGMMGF